MSPRDEDVDVVEDMMLSRDIRASLLRKALKIRLHYFHTIDVKVHVNPSTQWQSIMLAKLHRC